MPKTVVLGNGPIAFTKQGGQMLLIPLSALTLDGKTIQANPPYNEDEILQWLQYLVHSGVLTAGPTPAPKPAMTITAADPGSAGNYIQVTFSNIVLNLADPKKTTFDAIITETDTYDKLSIDPDSEFFISKMLGTETKAGSKPGLVHIKDADTPSLPKKEDNDYKLISGSDTQNSIVPIPHDSSSDAFHVEAKKPGEDGDNTTVTISNVNASAKTFTLVAVWNHKITSITLKNLEKDLQGSGYEIKVAKPTGGDYAIPAPGTISLSGGADARSASKASAIVSAS